jgi:hypothetical protein
MELLEAIPYGAFFLEFPCPCGSPGLEIAQMLTSPRSIPPSSSSPRTSPMPTRAFELDALELQPLALPVRAPAKTAERCDFRSAFKKPPVGTTWLESGEDDEDEGEETVKVYPEGGEEDDRLWAEQRQAWDFKSRAHMPEIEKLPITLDGRLVLVPYDQIIFIEAYEDYSYVHTSGSKYLTSHRLKNLEDRLKPHRFFRVHRKFLVNLDMVTEIASLPGSNFMLRTDRKSVV